MEISKEMKAYQIRVAEPNDHYTLSSIATESKGYWGYSRETIETWRGELTITTNYIRSNYVFKLIPDTTENICGFCAIEWHRQEQELEVAHLWLKPEVIGKKLGRYLFEASLENVRTLPVKRIRVTADPNAEKFYERLGFVQVSYVESSPPGRFLPELVMEF